MIKYIKLLLSLTIMFTIGCEDNDDEAGATSVAFDTPGLMLNQRETLMSLNLN